MSCQTSSGHPASGVGDLPSDTPTRGATSWDAGDRCVGEASPTASCDVGSSRSSDSVAAGGSSSVQWPGSNRYRRLTVRDEHREDIHQAYLLLGRAIICWDHAQGRC